jgi:hypothetical protein
MALPSPDDAQETRFKVSSLSELDALVGGHLTREKPQTHWEDSRTHCQFATLDEALETMHDLFFRELVLPAPAKPAVLTEIREYPPYSRDLNLAWRMVTECLISCPETAVVIRRRADDRWSVALGEDEPVEGATVAIALCVAALQTQRIRVLFAEEDSPRDRVAVLSEATA